jgi:hypothetical protein
MSHPSRPWLECTYLYTLVNLYKTTIHRTSPVSIYPVILHSVPDFSEEPVCIYHFRQNPVFTSLHLRSPVHVVPPQEIGTVPTVLPNTSRYQSIRPPLTERSRRPSATCWGVGEGGRTEKYTVSTFFPQKNRSGNGTRRRGIPRDCRSVT